MNKIALVGNPNVGKSTVFNALTGLRQHTGNWPGKTVELALGHFTYKGMDYELVDLPGTYCLQGESREEEITGEFIAEETTDGILILCDGTCLERSLHLALQVIPLCPKVLVAVNLMDEAEKMGLHVDIPELSVGLGVAVIGICGKEKKDLELLQEHLRLLTQGFLPYAPPERKGENWELSYAQELTDRVCRRDRGETTLTDRLDRILLRSVWAYPCAFALLLGILWLTVRGANYPSVALERVFSFGATALWNLLSTLPSFSVKLLIEGIYEPVTRVIAVMLPPMAIFFPLFTLLEDFGYLPRLAFLLDEGFRRSGGCGKQALTMAMGFGCNGVGVTGCRIMDSPKDRLIGIVTNSLVPCNGRFPSLILLMAVILGRTDPGLRALGLSVLIGLSVLMTLVLSRFLHRRVVKDQGSIFVMELPPYRRPKVGQVILRSFLDRCLTILGRAVAVAAPMGVGIWLLKQIPLGEGNVITFLGTLLEGPGRVLGIGGTMLLAFLLGSPANELVIPIWIMVMTGGGWGFGGAEISTQALTDLGLTAGQGLCTMVFMLFHWPCTTTLWTIYKETKRLSYTLLAWALPTGVGVVLCILVNLLLHL